MSPENPPDDLSADELALMSDLTEIANTITDDDRERVAPPPDIWAGIENGIFSSVESDSTDTDDSTLIDLTSERSARENVSSTPPAEESSQRGMLLLVAAAIVGLLVIGGASIALLGGDSNPVYAAEISNEDLPEPFDGTATATVELDDDPMIVINFNDPLPTDEPVELWVLNADASDIVSLGLVEPGATTFEWPEGLTPTDYPLVDLSIEPADGDETHSGRSILRGQLTLDA